MGAMVDNVVQLRKGFFDSFTNFLAGFGTWKDKSQHQHWTLNVLDQGQLESAFRSDWVARKIVQLPAFDAARAWRSWEATQKQVEALEEAERHFGYQLKLNKALEKARLYGGAAIIMGVNQGKFHEELNLDKVGRDDLKFIHVVGRYMMQAGPLVRDILSPYFGEPSYYMRSNIVTPPSPGNVKIETHPLSGAMAGDVLYIHPSRVVQLVGHEYPDMEMAPDAWGDSVLQTVQEALKDAGMVTSSIATMISEAKLDVVKIPGLLNMLSTETGSATLTARFSHANVTKSVINALLIDKDEEWTRAELGLENVDKVLQMYLFICCGAADIPATRLLGREPAGQNATGEGDTRNYYDKLSSEQTVNYTPALSRLDEVLIRHTLGKRDPSIKYDWNPLWQLSGTEQSEVTLKKAQAFKIDAESGLIKSDALARGRVAQLVEDGVYPGMSAEDDEALDLELLAKERENELNPPQPPGFPPSGGGGPSGASPSPEPSGTPPPAKGGMNRPPGKQTKDFDPSQARDPDGKWSGSGTENGHGPWTEEQHAHVTNAIRSFAEKAHVHSGEVEQALRDPSIKSALKSVNYRVDQVHAGMQALAKAIHVDGLMGKIGKAIDGGADKLDEFIAGDPLLKRVTSDMLGAAHLAMWAVHVGHGEVEEEFPSKRMHEAFVEQKATVKDFIHELHGMEIAGTITRVSMGLGVIELAKDAAFIVASFIYGGLKKHAPSLDNPQIRKVVLGARRMINDIAHIATLADALPRRAQRRSTAA